MPSGDDGDLAVRAEELLGAAFGRMMCCTSIVWAGNPCWNYPVWVSRLLLCKFGDAGPGFSSSSSGEGDARGQVEGGWRGWNPPGAGEEPPNFLPPWAKWERRHQNAWICFKAHSLGFSLHIPNQIYNLGLYFILLINPLGLGSHFLKATEFLFSVLVWLAQTSSKTQTCYNGYS